MTVASFTPSPPMVRPVRHRGARWRRCLTLALLLVAGTAVVAGAQNSPFYDYRAEKPGRRHHIRPADLPPPNATKSASNPPHVIDRPRGAWPKVPAGFKVDVYATGFIIPRQLCRAPNGDVFMAELALQKVYLLRGVDAAGRARIATPFAVTGGRVSGLAFYPPGPNPRWLYVANTHNVIRFPYRNGDLHARGPAQTVVAHLPAEGNVTRALCFSHDGRQLYIGLGSVNNISDLETTPQDRDRAVILACQPDGSGMHVHARGLRNPNGLVLSPVDHALWTTCVERDGLGDNLVTDFVTRVKPGADYGWPYRYIGDHVEPRLKGGPLGGRGSVVTPDVLLQPHSIPLQLAFYTGSAFGTGWHDTLFSTMHGSWNRSERTGYCVVRIFMRADGRARGDYEDFMTGFVTPRGEVWGRPVGVVETLDGALLVSDDASGSVWRVSRVRRKR